VRDVAENPYAGAAEHGIRRLAIPTPFAVGRVNVYLIEDDPLTLVDAGPNSGSSLDELQRQLGAHGYAIEDLELILITHQHIDHIGLVEIVASHSGADVAAIDHLVPFVENYREAAADDDAFAMETMLRGGIPADVAQALASVSLAFRAWGSRASVSRTLHEGDEIEFRDRTLEVGFRPGHSPTDTVFHDRARRMLVAGDHLIKHISSNPLISRPVGSKERPRSLMTYIDSLKKTQAMDLDLVLPGHGDPVTDHAGLIDSRVALHARRADKIHRLIAERSRTAYEVAQAMWGNIAVTQAYLTLSEVVGHVDMLTNDGRVVEREEDGVVRFESVAPVDAAA
jgi:glyoxylase-like metal-dependent hydrolase (beta-lactamase superfamily II)